MFSWQIIKEIINAVTIPVMAKARVGHFVEAQILQALGVDMVDESEGEKQQPMDHSMQMGLWQQVHHLRTSGYCEKSLTSQRHMAPAQRFRVALSARTAISLKQWESNLVPIEAATLSK